MGKTDLHHEFAKFGEIKKVMVRDHYAFIDFDSHSAAVAAVEEMNNKPFMNGDVLKVQQSLPREA